MFVTGIITNHNYSDLVCASIKSFLSQDYEKKRLVIIDDGSVDTSKEKINDLAPPDTEVFFFEESRGQSWAKNFGVQHAWDYTDVFAFLDADDEYMQGEPIGRPNGKISQ